MSILPIPVETIQPTIEFIVKTVIAVETTFGGKPGQGAEKKKQVWAEVAGKLYDIGDALLGLPDVVDKYVKETLIPQAIDKACEFLNKPENEFTKDKQEATVAFVLNNLEGIQGA